MSMTVRRGGPPARPRVRRDPPGTARVLAAYLAAAFVLLAVVFTLRPAQGPAPAAPTWDYQRETVALEGGGALNAYARWAVRATAAVTRARSAPSTPAFPAGGAVASTVVPVCSRDSGSPTNAVQ